jgi:hypothetical protein
VVEGVGLVANVVKFLIGLGSVFAEELGGKTGLASVFAEEVGDFFFDSFIFG